jgi:two-component system, NarL family, sensor histidine kinase UhpB
MSHVPPSHRDIPEGRRDGETPRRHSQAVLARLVELFPDAILTADARGQIAWVNVQTEKMFGYTRDELVDQPVEILVPERFRQIHAAHRRGYSQEPHRRSMGAGLELFGRRKDGTEFPVDIMLSPIETDEEYPIVIAVIRDITERKRAERALRQAEAKYRAIVEGAVEGIFQTSPDGRFLAANPALARMLGYPSPEALLAVVSDIAQQLYARPTRRADFRRLLGEQGMVQGFEAQLVRRDGSLMWGATSARAVSDERGSVLYYEGTIQDITARRAAEEELRRSREQLRALAARLESIREEERTRIAREIHDDLGQTLTGLKIDASWLANHLGNENPRVRRKVAAMETLIDTTIQRVRRIAAELRPGILDDLGLAAAIDWQRREFRSRTGIRCRFRSTLPDLPLDRELSTGIFRICQEALTNIIRHAQATRISIHLAMEGELLVLSVEDDGRGITDQELISSTSLGLLGMRERALLLGGELTVVGKPSKGTTVMARVPLRRSEG